MAGRSGHRAVGLAGLLLAAALAGCAGPKDNGDGPDVSLDSRLRVAQAAASAGDEGLAASLYAAAAASAPQDSAVQVRAAAALAGAGKIAEARQVLLRRLKLAPDDAAALRALAGLDLTEGRAADAIVVLDRVLAKRADDAAALADKGVALDMERRHAAAQAVYRQALRAAPEDVAIRNDLALSLLLSGHLREATDALAPLEDSPNLPPRARATLALLYALAGQSARARAVAGTDLPPAYVAEVARAVAAGRPLPPS